jgi:hypothetical protein
MRPSSSLSYSKYQRTSPKMHAASVWWQRRTQSSTPVAISACASPAASSSLVKQGTSSALSAGTESKISSKSTSDRQIKKRKFYPKKLKNI